MRVRTGYSFRQAYGKLETVLDRVAELDWPAAPITDRHSCFGWVRWDRLCRERGIRPVFGVELGVTWDLAAKKPPVDYWVFLALDDVAAVNKLVRLAGKQRFLTLEQAMTAAGVIKMVGHRTPLYKLAHHYGDSLYIGLSPACTLGYIKLAINLGFNFLATSDNRYPYNTGRDRLLYELLAGRGANLQVYDQFLQTDFEWTESIKHLVSVHIAWDAVKNRNFLLDCSAASLKKATMAKPPRPASLLELCREGAEDLGITLSDSRYADRLKHELEVIYDKKFEDYFYLLADLCAWARPRLLVGPARGSAAGSLVCYLLGITRVDPIKWDLLFERFVDRNRADLPDVDLDFSDVQREQVFTYLEQTYGVNKVARLGTVNFYQTRSTLNELGGALGAPRYQTARVADLAVTRDDGDDRLALPETFETVDEAKRLLEQYPAMEHALALEGHPRHAGQHAAGVVVTAEPVTDTMAMDVATHCDKRDAEDLNLLKIDVLGLTQLSVFEEALELAGLDRNHLETVPLDDPEAFRVLNDGRFTGIFQYNGKASQGLCRQMTVDRIDDVIALTALARPGPLDSGAARDWLKRRKGEAQVEYYSPAFEPILSPTYGVLVYQEQVMRIAREVGGLSWEDVTALRKGIGKKKGADYLATFRDKLIEGAVAKGEKRETIEKVWEDVCYHGAYSFNKSHAVAYGLISYRCCWLKAHHPFEFAAATLSHTDDEEEMRSLLRELEAEGYTYEPIDPERSTDKWTVHGKKLLGPLTLVHGMGPKLVAEAMSARRRGEPLPDRVQKLLAGAKTPVDSLYPVRDYFQKQLPDPVEMGVLHPSTKPITVETIPERAKDSAVVLFIEVFKITEKDDGSLNLQLRDDTGTIFGKIRKKSPGLAKKVREHGVGHAIIKGTIFRIEDFTGIMLERVRFV